MEGAVPSLRRRRAWSQRQWITVEDQEPHTLTHNSSTVTSINNTSSTVTSITNTSSFSNVTSFSTSMTNDDLNNISSIVEDDVFADGQDSCGGSSGTEGCRAGKIESWLQACGSELSGERTRGRSFNSAFRSPDDELSLGADADTVKKDNTDEAKCAAATRERRSRLTSGRARPELSLPQSQGLGHSVGSSCFSSSSTWTSTTSVSEVLQGHCEDAEETLMDLGFGFEDPQVPVRIPARFFSFPSQSNGINFRLFLDAQLQRIQDEDLGLTLASRFRQVQVLTETANAFYSLYSHVSRTALQKLPAPEVSFSSPLERMYRTTLRSDPRDPRTDPRSPVDKLKDTVSKMCLYTGSTREPEGWSPQPRAPSSLPELVETVMEKSKPGHVRKLDLGDTGGNKLKNLNQIKSCGDVVEMTDPKMSPNDEADICQSVELEKLNNRNDIASSTCFSYIPESIAHNSKPGHVRKLDLGDTGGNILKNLNQIKLCGDLVEMTDPKMSPNDEANICESVELDIRTHSVSETKGCFSCSSESGPWTDPSRPHVKTSFDQICPKIVERIHQAPFDPHHSQNTASAGTDMTDLSSENQGDESKTVPPSGTSVSADSVKGCRHRLLVRLPGSLKTLPSHSGQFLSPLQPHVSSNLQQVNSFELEEVQSAGEEDSAKGSVSDVVVRGDSLQSDSSGYADEDPLGFT